MGGLNEAPYIFPILTCFALDIGRIQSSMAGPMRGYRRMSMVFF